jgi:hypothetical protein
VAWQPAQDHLATLSANSLHRVAKATTHESLLDDQADSATASQAIHDVVTAVRTSHRLPHNDGVAALLRHMTFFVSTDSLGGNW